MFLRFRSSGAHASEKAAEAAHLNGWRTVRNVSFEKGVHELWFKPK
ncbi:hypothetical protein RISK_001637 [Rhodopirellula islandica]|uniref:Uncharacterized protein n=1 Tax=Rhodopirellula islandica TaxID=595434 RepID=A0A0J1BIR0_RHOIS|nr:hypothetical protein RISK_001637 [Rhodopirellula islandica]